MDDNFLLDENLRLGITPSNGIKQGETESSDFPLCHAHTIHFPIQPISIDRQGMMIPTSMNTTIWTPLVKTTPDR